MDKSNFLDLQIKFSQQNHCSVFFAHLQNTLKKVESSQKQGLNYDKICRILYDIFKEHQKLQKSYQQLCKNMKEMMTQFATMINQCKDDRQKLMAATKDRYDMLQKLKQCNQDAIQVSNQNDMLKQTIQKMKQLNQLLIQKNQVTQQQLANRKVAEIGTENFQRISKQYDRLLQSNSEIRKQLSKIANQSENINKMSKTMQIINNAFKNNPNIRDEVWKEAKMEQKGPPQIQNYQYQLLKKQFYQFNFDQIIDKIRSQISG